jgi:hypothetical protein
MAGAMSDLLTSARPGSARADGEEGRSLVPAAALAGAVAAVSVLLGLMALSLVGWLTTDSGRHGDTPDALRVGADAWLLGHGAGLRVDGAEVTVVPLGVTLFCGYVVLRLATWAAGAAVVRGPGTLVLGGVVLALSYATSAGVTAILASAPEAGLSAIRAFLGGFLVGGAFAAPGLLTGSGRWPEWRERVPRWLRAVLVGALTTVMLMLAVGAAVLLVALLRDFGSAATVLSRLHTEPAGGLLYTLVASTFVPNAVLLSCAYLVGPGFAVGTGTVVSPSAVVLGPVPAFPLLAALPGEGDTPWWTTVLVATPVLVSLLAAWLVAGRYPVEQYEMAALRGLVSGALAGVLLGGLVALAGGAVGPGRMAEVGAAVPPVALNGAVAMGVGGIVGGLGATWRHRRRQQPPPSV